MSKPKTFPFWDFNIWQTLATTGFVVSAMSQAGLYALERQVDHFTNVYWIWLVVFMGGTMLRYYYFKQGIEPGHHH